MKKLGIEVTGIWLVAEGVGTDCRMVVKAEVDGRWVEVIREYCPDAPPISHIVEPGGIREAAAS